MKNRKKIDVKVCLGHAPLPPDAQEPRDYEWFDNEELAREVRIANERWLAQAKIRCAQLARQIEADRLGCKSLRGWRNRKLKEAKRLGAEIALQAYLQKEAELTEQYLAKLTEAFVKAMERAKP